MQLCRSAELKDYVFFFAQLKKKRPSRGRFSCYFFFGKTSWKLRILQLPSDSLSEMQ